MWGEFSPSQALVNEMLDVMCDCFANSDIAKLRNTGEYTGMSDEAITAELQTFAHGFRALKDDPAMVNHVAKAVTSRVAIHAQRARYEPGRYFALIEDGKFTKAFFDEVGDYLLVPTGEAGDAILHKLAAEFLAWLKANVYTMRFSEYAPFERFDIEADRVVVNVRPAEEIPHDHAFIRATVIE